MYIYLILLLVILYCIVTSRLIIAENNNSSIQEIYLSRNKFTLFFWAIVLFGLAFLKGIEVGTDSSMYYYIYIFGAYNDLEPGIAFFYTLATKYGHYLIFSFLIYSILIFFFSFGIKKNCPNYLISIFLFVTTFTYYISYNQIRQMIAISIIFCFVHLLTTNKRLDKLKFLLAIIVAALFHYSALFIVFLFFIPIRKMNNQIIILLFFSTIVLYFLPEVKNVIGNLIIKFSGFYTDKYMSNLSYFFEMNKEKGVVELIPVVIQMLIVITSLYFLQSRVQLSINNKLFNLTTNIYVLSLCLYAFAGIEAIDRMQLYFSSFNIYYYSFLIHLLLNNRKNHIAFIFIVGIISFWILFYIIRLSRNIQGIVPYSLF